jgi:hypothetical protein
MVPFLFALLVSTPAEVSAFGRKVEPLLTSSARLRIEVAAGTLGDSVAQGTMTETSGTAEVEDQFPNRQPGDVRALLAYVHYRAAMEAQKDLERLLEEQEKALAEKEALRRLKELLEKLEDDSTPAANVAPDPMIRRQTPFLHLAYEVPAPRKPVDITRLDRNGRLLLIASSKANIEAIDAASGRISMTLETMNDRYAKLIALLTSMIRKLNDEQIQALRNLK